MASSPSSAQDPSPTSTHPGPCPEGEPTSLETAAQTIARLEERVAKADKEIEELRGKRARKPSAFATAARGIHKLVTLFEPLIELQREADRRSDYGDKTTNPQDQRAADRKYKSYILLMSLLPETRSKIAKGDAALREFFTEAQARADVARGDDISKVKAAVAEWLNASPYNCTPPLSSRSREKRGFQNRVTGKQMSPIEYDCDDPVVFENIKRGHRDFLLSNSFFYNAFFPPDKGNPNDVEHLFLRGPLLLKTVCLIFTAPSSSDTVDDDDGEEEASESSPSKKHKDNAGKATKSPVATLLHMNGEITPRAIAYAAVLLHFNLTNASQWAEERFGVSYPALYNFIIDYFEGFDPSTEEGQLAKVQCDALLHWYNERVFPNRVIATGNSEASYDKLAVQRAAKVAAARAAATAHSS